MIEKSVILKEKKPFTYQISAFTLLIFGILFIFSGFSYFLGVLLCLISAFFIIMIRGTEIDFNKKRYRKIKIFGKFVSGKWLNLPEIKYISLFRAIMTQELKSVRTVKTEISEKYILINLIHENNKRLTVYKTQNFEDALNKAKLISKNFKIKIYDATSKDKKWLN